jgi:hypothetical protein
MDIAGLGDSGDEKITRIVNKFKGFLTLVVLVAVKAYRSSPFLATVLVASP